MLICMRVRVVNSAGDSVVLSLVLPLLFVHLQRAAYLIIYFNYCHPKDFLLLISCHSGCCCHQRPCMNPQRNDGTYLSAYKCV